MPTGLEAFPSALIDQLSSLLKFLMILHIVLGILSLTIDTITGLYLLINALLIYCVIKTRNWCTALFYIFMALFELLSGIDFVGSFVAYVLAVGSQGVLGAGLLMLKVPLYFVTVYYMFLLYRELKAMFIENAGNAGYELPRFDADPPRAPARQYFQGEGHRLN
jgi:hypothetical protein